MNIFKKSLYKKELKKAIATIKQTLVEKEVDILRLNVIYTNTVDRGAEENLVEQCRKNIEVQANNVSILRKQLAVLTEELYYYDGNE